MKKNGFTLIELLAVLILLSLIAVIAISTVSSSINSYRQELYDNQINNIENAARLWSSDNMLILPNDSSTTGNICEYENINSCTDNYNKLIIKLSDLQNGGYIEQDIKDPKTKQKFENLEIIITKSSKKLNYEVIDQTYAEYKIGDKIIVKLNDSEQMNFYVIENSTKQTKYVNAIKETALESNLSWCKDCTTNMNGPTTINENLSLLGWNNTVEKRLITSYEFNTIKEAIKNDEDKSWISGNYWTNQISETTKAFYVDSSLNLVSDVITNTHQVRPVIKISKIYVEKY